MYRLYFQKNIHLENMNVELNGWLSVSTFKKICSNAKWDFNIINYSMESLHSDPRVQESKANMKFELIREALRYSYIFCRHLPQASEFR